MFNAEQIGKDILDAIINGLLDLVMSLWGWLSSVTLGFIPTYVLVTVLVAVMIMVWFLWGTKGVIAFVVAGLAVFELNRRATADKSESKPSKHWPQEVPEEKKPRVRTIQDMFKRRPKT